MRKIFCVALVASLAICGTGRVFAQHEMKRQNRKKMVDKAPKVGDLAPTFKLKSLDGKSETDLLSYRGKKPVVLFFGSYT